MVSDDLPDVLWWHVFFLCIYKTKLALLGEPFGLQLKPFLGCGNTQEFIFILFIIRS